MTEQQISLVKQTWKIFREIDSAIIGDAFYSKLFVEVPQVKQLFKIPRKEQSAKLVEMINVIVGRLDRLSEITEDIKQLGIRHAGYGVKPSHYRPVGAALLWTLQQGLGSDWNEQVQDAWEACYKLLSDTMIKAAGGDQADAS